MMLNERRGSLWMGVLLLFVSGLLILLSTFMSWGGGATGWNLMFVNDVVTEPGTANVAFYYESPGHLIFTGLWTLIIGGLLMLIALLMAAARGPSYQGSASFLGFVALVFSVYNIVTIVQLGFGLGGGAIVYLVFAVLGLIGISLVQAAGFVMEEEAAPVEARRGGRPMRSRYGYRGEVQPQAGRHSFWRRRDIEKR